MPFLKILAGLIVGLVLGAFGANAFIGYIAGKASNAADGWYVQYGLGRYGDDYMLRAVMARLGAGDLPAEEALYFTANVDADKALLDGQYQYELTFAADALPDVGAFWSLTPYDAETQAGHPIDHIQIGNRAEDLRYGTDGSLTLFIQHDMPTDESRKANWLPVPEGAFSLTFTAYEPGEKMVAGDYVPPLLQRVGG